MTTPTAKERAGLTTADAIAHLRKALKSDQAYWHSWKANIAVQFQDEFHRSYRLDGLHKISNQAAENFLKLLTHESDRPEAP